MINELLVESVERALGAVATHESVAAAEDLGWSDLMWDTAVEMGLPWISLEERLGGSGGTVSDALEVLRIAGRHAVPLPLAECSLLAGWLLTSVGVAIDDSPITCASSGPHDAVELTDGALRGQAYRVPWASKSSRIAMLVSGDAGIWHIAIVRSADCQIAATRNLAGEPRETVTFEEVPVDVYQAPSGVDPSALQFRGALSRAALMAGALERISDMTFDYTHERHQFGKPVSSFQAVQQHLVHASQQAALVSMATCAAGAAAQQGRFGFEIAAAKSLGSQAATIATRAAHQAHGAIGMTREYQLQQFSRRMWAWRDEYGTEFEWNRWLGEQVQLAGADRLYPLITAGSALPRST